MEAKIQKHTIKSVCSEQMHKNHQGHRKYYYSTPKGKETLVIDGAQIRLQVPVPSEMIGSHEEKPWHDLIYMRYLEANFVEIRKGKGDLQRRR